MRGETPRCETLTPGEAAVALCESTFKFRERAALALPLLTELAELVPARRLTIGDLTQAVSWSAKNLGQSRNARIEEAISMPADAQTDSSRRLASAPAIRDDLMAADVGDEMVVFDPQTQQMHRFDPIAALVWSCSMAQRRWTRPAERSPRNSDSTSTACDSTSPPSSRIWSSAICWWARCPQMASRNVKRKMPTRATGSPCR